jgi:Mlc titration factor MtfA (ptsG expression regulator)
MFGWWKRHRRAALEAQPLTEAERAIVARNVPYVARLSEADRKELEGLVRAFLAEKSFEGCGGLEITDEIRLTIAAQACLLLLHRGSDLYPNLEVVLVYPSAYRAKTKRVEGGVVIEEEGVRLGESWTRGTVVLAWDSVKRDARSLFDGHNVVLHEFAHQLDSEDGAMDGAPDLGSFARYTEWARVLGEEYQELTARLHEGRPSDIDDYGATSPPEFFAVVTEMFFEKPRTLRRRHPALYAELEAFYAQDPAATDPGG